MWPEKSDFCIFFNFLPFLVANGPVHLWNRPSEGFWNMPTCFQMFVDVFETFKGVKNEIKQKTSFFSPIPLLKSCISKNEKCRAKTLTFWWFQCVSLTNWVSRMGKPLVPVSPTHLGHLGHPNPDGEVIKIFRLLQA